MATTEIQKVPGTFNLPAGWPRLTFPDTTTGLIADWKASSLPVGVLAPTGWASLVGTLTPLTPNSTVAQPTVKTDGKGNRYLQMATSRLQTPVSWTGNITILAVLRPILTSARVARVASGGGDGYRSLNTANSAGFSIATNKSTSAGSTVTNAVSGELTAVVGRYGASELDGTRYGGTWSTPVAVTGHPTQSVLYVGGNSALEANAFLEGDLYEIQVWNRILPKADAEAALQVAANTYGI